MGKPDVVYECYADGVNYRLSPNPDAPRGTGFRHGAVLVHDGDGAGIWVWQSAFFISPEAMEAIGLALLEAAKENRKEEKNDE